MNNVVTVLFQNHESHFFRDRLDLSSINYKKNVGHVLEAALRAIGLRWHPSGKCIWWAAEPNGEKLQWLKPAKTGSRAPKPHAPSAMEQADAVDLQHDGSAAAGGSRTAQAAAAAARPPLPRALQLVPAPSGERIGRIGTGWGHVPRPITERCIAEQANVDDLVLRVQHHARTCGAPLCRVHDDNIAQWGCHSVGVVNVCRYVCAAGCSMLTTLPLQS